MSLAAIVEMGCLLFQYISLYTVVPNVFVVGKTILQKYWWVTIYCNFSIHHECVRIKRNVIFQD